MPALWVKKVARLASRAIEQFIVIGCPICGCFDDVFHGPAAGCGDAAVGLILPSIGPMLHMAGMGCPNCRQEQYRLPTQRCHGRLRYTKRQQQHVCRGFLDEISDFMNGEWA